MNCRSRAGAGSKASDGPVDESQKLRAFRRTVDRQALPIAPIPQIGEEAGAILMEMQKRFASPIEYSRPLLDEARPSSEAHEQIAQAFERASASVFHRLSYSRNGFVRCTSDLLMYQDT